MVAATPLPAEAHAVLAFWFGSEERVDPRWFNGGAAFDDEIRRRHGATVAAALAGHCAGWAAAGPQGTLALIVVLDQFTRNVHRSTPQAFAGDPQALALARGLVARGEHRPLPPLQRWFALMPLEHAEDRALQAQCVALFEELAADAAGGTQHAAVLGALDYARKHQVVVERFGRFPHRNAILGRVSTAEEAAFLQQPGSRF